MKSNAVALIKVLSAARATIAVAESLTGGDVCARLVDVPGASLVVRGGVVAYATELKHEILGVDKTLLDEGGPVQAEVALQMALGVARLCGADFGIATTGVAGPGDSADGPQGLVFVAAVCAKPGAQSVVRRLELEGARDEIRSATVDIALGVAHNLVTELGCN